MRCSSCLNSMKETHGQVVIRDPYLGRIYVNLDEYYLCENCGNRAFPSSALTKIDEARTRLTECYLRTFPLGGFISQKRAAKILGISRQALSKNKRIRNGFIFHTHLGKRPVYLKKSVLLYRKNGDGRFPLAEYDDIAIKYSAPVKTEVYEDSTSVYKAITSSLRESAAFIFTREEKRKRRCCYAK